MKIKGIILAVILSLASIMMPFNLYADTISASNVVGVNVELLGSTTLEHREDQGNNYYYKQYSYKAVIELDNSYVGVIGARVQGQYYEKAPAQGSQLLTQTFNYYRKIYVNGNSAEMTFVVSTWYSSVQDPINYRSDGTSPAVSIEDSNVTKYEDLNSLDQIIDLLSDIYQNSSDIEGLSTNILSELENVVSNTSLANTYLETLTKLKQWHMPIESFSYSYSLLNKYPNKVITTQNMYYFNYPVFQLNSGDEVFNMYINNNTQYVEWIIGIDKNVPSDTLFRNFITGSEQFYIRQYTPLNQNYGTLNVEPYMRIVKLMIFSNGNQNSSLRIYVNSDVKIIPIYMRRSDQLISVSTDFALIYGLSNQLLDDIHIIAQGTNQSNSAASDLESGNDQMADDMNDLATIENGYNEQFNNQLQSIDFTSPIQNNAGILPAANFVITIFNGLINNNPFSVLIIIVCILLIGKKVIGK